MEFFIKILLLKFIKCFSIYNQNPVSKVEIALVELPTERYKRNVVRGKLDLVGKIYLTFQQKLFLVIIFLILVSIGGTTGLFVGASLLSFVEIFYYITIRPYGSMLYEKRLVRQHLQQNVS